MKVVWLYSKHVWQTGIVNHVSGSEEISVGTEHCSSSLSCFKTRNVGYKSILCLHSSVPYMCVHLKLYGTSLTDCFGYQNILKQYFGSDLVF